MQGIWKTLTWCQICQRNVNFQWTYEKSLIHLMFRVTLPLMQGETDEPFSWRENFVLKKSFARWMETRLYMNLHASFLTNQNKAHDSIQHNFLCNSFHKIEFGIVNKIFFLGRIPYICSNTLVNFNEYLASGSVVIQ